MKYSMQISKILLISFFCLGIGQVQASDLEFMLDDDGVIVGARDANGDMVDLKGISEEKLETALKDLSDYKISANELASKLGLDDSKVLAAGTQDAEKFANQYTKTQSVTDFLQDKSLITRESRGLRTTVGNIKQYQNLSRADAILDNVENQTSVMVDDVKGDLNTVAQDLKHFDKGTISINQLESKMNVMNGKLTDAELGEINAVSDKYNAIDEVDKDGYFLDEDGKRVDEEGYLLDKDGKRVIGENGEPEKGGTPAKLKKPSWDKKPIATEADFARYGKAVRNSRIAKLKSLRQEYIDAATPELKKAALEKISDLYRDMAVDSGMRSVLANVHDLQANLGDLADRDAELLQVTKQQLDDVRAAADKIELKDFLDDDSVAIKDEEGHIIGQKFKFDETLDTIQAEIDKSSEKMLHELRQDLSAKMDAIYGKMGFIDKRLASVWYRTGAITKKLDRFNQYVKSDMVGDIADGFCSAGRKLAKGLKFVGKELWEMLKGLANGVLFMLPNLAQSSFLAQKQRSSALEELASPIQVGPWVMQIPDSCFNLDNPEATIPLYVRIPVAESGASLLPEAYSQYNGSIATAPLVNNPITNAIHSFTDSILHLLSDSSLLPARYIISPQYYNYNPGMIVTYFPGGFQPWGSVSATSSQFTSGQLIDLTTGVVIDGSGDQINTTGMSGFAAYPMIVGPGFDWHASSQQQAPILSPPDLKSACAQMRSKLMLSDDSIKFTEFVNVLSGSKGADVSSTIENIFDCSCLSQEMVSTCNTQTSNCILSTLFDQYQAGVSLDESGAAGLSNETAGATTANVATMTTNVAATTANVSPGSTPVTPEVNWANAIGGNALGSVIPMFGWGSSGANIINNQMFPGYQSLNLTSYLSHKIDPKSTGNVSMEQIQFADEDKNYSAAGCWIYISASTPFARAVQNGSSQTSVYGSYVDYIIFLDDQNNQVPLLVPMQKTHTTLGFTDTQLEINPDAKYWTSLAAFNAQANQLLYQFADAASGDAIKYKLSDGSAWADPSLTESKGAIATALKDLSTNFDNTGLGNLNDQFFVHQQVMINRLQNGPFMYGNVALTSSNYVASTGTGANAVQIQLYEASNCYGSGTTDLLMAAINDTTAGSVTPINLPNPAVNLFYSLVTDIGYTVVNNSLVPTYFSNAPLTQNSNGSYAKNESLMSTFFGLDSILEPFLEAQQALAKGGTPYIDLCGGTTCSATQQSVYSYVQSLRTTWMQSFDTSIQKQGVQVGQLTCMMPSTFNSKIASANSAFIYEVVPNPSAALCDHDIFVLVNNASPTLQRLAPATVLDAEVAANQSTVVLVSLVTGYLFDTNGNQLMESDNVTPQRLSVPLTNSNNIVQIMGSEILDQMTTAFNFETIDPTFVATYQGWVDQYEAQMHRPMGPYKFGSLRLGIMAGDDAIGNYVYFNAAGMHKSNFSPSDVFVTYNSTANTYGHKLSKDTESVISLVSGNVYNPDGSIALQLPGSAILNLTSTLSAKWGNWLTGIVTTLQKAMMATIAAQDAEQQQLDDLLTQAANSYNISLDGQTAHAIIARLQPNGLKGLPAPYGLLKYDPVNQNFVHVSPGGTDASHMLYLFFDIGTDKSTGKHIGGIFQDGASKAQLTHVVKNAELKMMEDQFGVVVDDAGQHLAVPLTQPSFIMSDDSKQVTMGSNSLDHDLICSTSDLFPGGPVEMPKGYFLYYSATMNAYYVYDTRHKYWISVVPDHEGNGHIYSKTGEPITYPQKVAISTIKNNTDDLMLLYENTKDALQAYMSNGGNYVNAGGASNAAMTWTNMQDGTDITVSENKTGTKYTVTDQKGTTTTYQVSDDYAWYSLFAVADPIDESGNLVTTGVSFARRQAQLVQKGNQVTNVRFNGVMYKVSAGSGTSYTLVPVDQKNTGQIKITLGKDSVTQALTVMIDDGKKTYQYMHINNFLNPAQFQAYRTVFGGTTATATHSFAFGPQDKTNTQTIKVGDTTVVYYPPRNTTNVLFAKDIESNSAGDLALNSVSPSSILGIPDKNDAGYKEFLITQPVFFENINLVKASSDGRFFVEIPAASNPNNNSAIPTFSYVSNGAWVDLHSGILYNADNGVCLGYCLNLDDLLSVLNTVYVSVVRTIHKDKEFIQLAYRSPQIMNAEVKQLSGEVAKS